jgi:hypothetical protein
MCILRDLPQQKNPRALCQGSSPNFVCSHVPMEIFLFYKMRKKWENKKRVVYVMGGSCTSAFSWGLGTPSSSRTWVPLAQENTLVIQEPPLQLSCLWVRHGEIVNTLGLDLVTHLWRILETRIGGGWLRNPKPKSSHTRHWLQRGQM